jgi:hypothetical protein
MKPILVVCLSALLGAAAAQSAHAQLTCGTASPTPSQLAALKARLDQYVAPSQLHPVTIPVVFHVIRPAIGADGDVPQQWIDDQIAVLNLCFSGTYGGTSTFFTFVLQDTIRTTNPFWFEMDDNTTQEMQAKQALHTGGPETLNFYSVDAPEGIGGWSSFPEEYEALPWDDGVVVDYQTLPGGAIPGYNLGRIGCHEVGHWLGLLHTFEGFSCTGDGDEVDDTPPELTFAFDCEERDTCPGGLGDPIHNFMEYSPDACKTEFTPGQGDRTEMLYHTFRNPDAPPPPTSAPTLLEPIGTTEGHEPLFQWQGVAGATEYRVKVKVAGQTVVNELVDGTELLSPISFSSDVTPTWLVRGVNAGGEGPPSEEKPFHCVDPFPSAPDPAIALAPGHPFPSWSCVDSLTPTLTWTEAARAARYQVALLETSPETVVFDIPVEETFYTVPESLTPGRQYHWHVKSVNSRGITTFVNTLSFKPQCGPPLPSLTIGDVIVMESLGGSTSAVFTPTLSAASSTPVTAAFATSPGSATSGADYTAVGGVLTFPAQTTTATVTVPILDDARDEDTETFFVDLSNAVGATLTDTQGMGSIVDNDPKPTLAVGDVAVLEGQSGTQNATFPLSLSAPSGRTVTVHYATANGTATAPADYAATNGDLTFNEGQQMKTVTVAVVGDTVWEPEETFFLGLSVPDNVELPDPAGQASIVNDDPPTLSVSDVFMNEGPSLATGHFAVSLVAPSIVDVTVKYETQNCTALAGQDYASSSGTLTFIPGQTSKSIPLTPVADPNFEGSETYFVNLSSPTAATIADGRGQATLLNDDARPGPRPGLPPADVNGDGHADLLFRHQSSGELSTWLMKAIHRTSGVALEPLPDLAWRVVGTGDFTNDGKTDIVWRHDTSGQLAVWFMNGTVKVGGVLLPGLGDTAWKVGGSGDFNQDGRTDLLWRHDTTGALKAWLMNGTTVTGETPLNPSALSDTQWRIVGTGDFNRDGHTDILWRHETSAQLVVWYMQGTQLVDGDFLSEPSPADPQWQIAAIVDIDGDDDADLLWRHGLSGQLVAWLMEGHVLQCGVTLDPDRLADLAWRVVGPR